MERTVLDTKEVADLLNISRSTVYAMVKDNQLPNFKVRGKIMFNKNMIEEWTRGHHQNNDFNMKDK